MAASRLVWFVAFFVGQLQFLTNQNNCLAMENDLMPLPVNYHMFELDSLLSFDYWTAGNAPTTTNWDILHNNGMINTTAKLLLADDTTLGKTVVSSTNVGSVFFQI